MAKLNEYIGSIVSSITNARVMSDIKAVKVAEDYSKHKLLQYFSIPRMRIENVELTIPMALDRAEESVRQEFEPIDNKKFNTITYREILNSFGLPKLPLEISRVIQSEIALKTQRLEQSIKTSGNKDALKTFISELALFSMKTIETSALASAKILSKNSMSLLQERLELSLEAELKLSEVKKITGDLEVIAETYKLKDTRPEHLIFIKLKISEEGMEWNRIENAKGELELKLLPE